jgi:hypothetical protein
MYSGDMWPHFWMRRFSFINVVCEILKSICDLYKYMLYLSHGKAKEKTEKRKKRIFPEGKKQKKRKKKGLPRVPDAQALGEG